MSIYQNLFKFQSKVRTIEKDSKGDNYKYASFDNIVSTINQALIDSNLGYHHYFEETDHKLYCVCVVFSADKENMINTTPTHPVANSYSDTTDTITVKLPLDNPGSGKSKMNAIQQLGASVTYARRYTLTAALGLVTEDDTDGVKKPALETKDN